MAVSNADLRGARSAKNFQQPPGSNLRYLKDKNGMETDSLVPSAQPAWFPLLGSTDKETGHCFRHSLLPSNYLGCNT